MSDGGKGSAPRPFAVDQATFASNWDAIFNGARLGADCGSNPPNVGSIPTAPAIYIDDATGAQVTEDWWPGDAHD